MSEPESVNLDSVVADLQAEIRRHRLALGESGILERPDMLARVRQTQWINPHLPIGWPELPKGFFPKIKVYVKKVARRLLRWYINPLVEQQNAYNTAVSEALSHLYSVISDNQTHTNDSLDELKKQLNEHDWEVIREHQEVDHQAEKRRYTEQLGAAAAQLKQSLEPLRLRLQRLEIRSQPAQPELSQSHTSEKSPEQAIDLFLLGAQYRNQSQMAQRLLDYDDLLHTLVPVTVTGSTKVPILDIGCGRGEMVGHLCKLGYTAYGVDIDADAIRLGQASGVDVRHQDAFAHLAGLVDQSLLGVIAIQVMEHLTIDDNVRFYKLVWQKLVPGGFILIETINPVCLWALTNHYLLDPSHRTPLHPQMTQFLLEQAGYWQTEIRFLHPVPDKERLDWDGDHRTDYSARGGDIIMHANIERLNAFLYGPQDYAAFALKPKE